MDIHNLALACAETSDYHIPREKLPPDANRKFKLFETRANWIFGAKPGQGTWVWLHACHNESSKSRQQEVDNRRKVVRVLQHEWGLSSEDALHAVGRLDHLRGNVFLGLKGETKVGEASQQDCCTTTNPTQKQTRLEHVRPVHPPAKVQASQGKFVASLPWSSLREVVSLLSRSHRSSLGRSVKQAWDCEYGQGAMW